MLLQDNYHALIVLKISFKVKKSNSHPVRAICLHPGILLLVGSVTMDMMKNKQENAASRSYSVSAKCEM